MNSHFQFRLKPLYYCLTVIIFTGETDSLIRSTYAGDLPAPPRGESDLNQVYKLYLELVINDYSTQQVIPLIVKGDDYYIDARKIQDLNIVLPKSYINNSQKPLTQNDILIMGFGSQASEWINLNALDEAKFEYLASRQTLILNLPPHWMPTQMLGRDSWYLPEKAQSGVGILNNYDIYITRPDGYGLNANVFLEQRLFSPYGVFKNSGIYTHNEKTLNQEGHSLPQNNGYRRYDTTWQYDHQDAATTFLLGDIISATKNSWGSAVRLGGVQIKRDFGTRPDLITYPLPQFSGQAALPSTVDLLINGQKTQSTDVKSGPFVINNLPYMTGRGEAVVVTTDAVGRQVSTSVPFYVSNDILKPGLFDYAFSAGQIRQAFGRENFKYGQFVSSIDARYGLYDWLTLESRAELSKDIQLAGLGSVLKIFNYGVFSGSYTNSRSDASLYKDRSSELKGGRNGAQYSLGYSYNQNRFGFSVNHTNRDLGYADLSRLEYSDLVTVNSHKITTAQTHFATVKSGTFGIGYIETKSNDFENKLLNLSWAPVIPAYMRNATVSVSASHDFIENNWSAGLQISIPLFRNSSTFNTGYNKDFNSNSSYVNYNRSVPSDGGFGVDLIRRFNEGQGDLNQAQIYYRNQYFNSNFGTSGIDGDYNYWLGLSGSFIAMKNGVFASSRLGESFALIDTNKVPDIPVKYENTSIGRTNRNGYIFVPSVSPYYTGKYSIDPLELPSSFTAIAVEKRMAAKRGSGILISFPITQSISANVYLVDQNNQPIPVGAMVHRADQESSYVGMDGIAYLDNLNDVNEITVKLPDSKVCKAQFKVDTELAKRQIVTISNVVCNEVEL